MCPIRIRDLTQHDPGTGSSPWLPAIVTSGQHTSKIVPTNSCITSKVRVTSSALMQSRPLERTETVVWTTKQIVRTDPADQNEGKSRAAGRLGGDGDFEAVRKRGKGFWRSSQCGTRHLPGQVCFKWARDGGCRRTLSWWTTTRL